MCFAVNFLIMCTLYCREDESGGPTVLCRSEFLFMELQLFGCSALLALFVNEHLELCSFIFVAQLH